MLNKVVVFVIFGPKCIFDASKHSNYPTCVTWTTLMMSLFPFWTRTVYSTYCTFSMEGQKALGLNLEYLKLCSKDEWRSYGLEMT